MGKEGVLGRASWGECTGDGVLGRARGVCGVRPGNHT